MVNSKRLSLGPFPLTIGSEPFSGTPRSLTLTSPSLCGQFQAIGDSSQTICDHFQTICVRSRVPDGPRVDPGTHYPVSDESRTCRRGGHFHSAPAPGEFLRARVPDQSSPRHRYASCLTLIRLSPSSTMSCRINPSPDLNGWLLGLPLMEWPAPWLQPLARSSPYLRSLRVR
jgi:hypothetical protein